MTQLAVIRRKAIKFDVQDLIDELGSDALSGVEVYIDKSNQAEIEEIMALEIKKTRRALSLALRGKYNEDLYDREKVSDKAARVTAIKYKGKLNDRIYCQEHFNGTKKIILITAYRKKGQKVDTKTKNVIETVGKYIFDLEKNG